MQCCNKQDDAAHSQEVEESPISQGENSWRRENGSICLLDNSGKGAWSWRCHWIYGWTGSECTSELIEQNAMYNGYHSDTMVNNIIAYGPDGKVFLCTINFPGSWHDGSIVANILRYIHNNIRNYKMCIDQGFPRSGMLILFLLVQLAKDKQRSLFLIWDHICFGFRTFIHLYIRQVSREWDHFKDCFLGAKRDFPVVLRNKKR